MTINIAIAVSEGLVMAADSLSQMSDKDGAINGTVHQSVEKITEFRGRPIALMIHGLGELRKRTIISLIREFEFNNSVLNNNLQRWMLPELVSHLLVFIKTEYDLAYPVPTEAEASNESRPRLGIIVGGYSTGQFFPEVYEISFPVGISICRFPESGESREYIDYWGQRSAVERLLYGYDESAVDTAERLAATVDDLRRAEASANPDPDDDTLTFDKLPEDLKALPAPPTERLVDSLKGLGRLLRMPNRLNGMPLQEAVEFAEYLGNVAIGYDRFKTGTPAVGGELDVVAIQPDGLLWYKRKAFSQQMATAREEALSQQERVRFRQAITEVEKMASMAKDLGVPHPAKTPQMPAESEQSSAAPAPED